MAEFSVASFNLHWGVDMRGQPFDALRAAADLDADIVVLPESWRPGDRAAMVDELARVTGATLHDVAFMSDRNPARPRHLEVGPGPAGTCGLAVLSRLPVLRTTPVPLPKAPGDVVEQRQAIALEIDVEGTTIAVAGIHASHRLWGSLPQLRALDRHLTSGTVPSVIAGDCNMWGPPIAAVLRGRRRAVRGRTWPAWRPHSQIDHIWIDDRFSVVDAAIGPNVGSDHRSVPRDPAGEVEHLDLSRRRYMAHEVRGVVARAKGQPVAIETIVVPDPGPGEALIDVQACGVCHTDLHYREGAINDDFPFLLGHEAAGVVAAVGPGVSSVEPGDFVVLNWRAVCGECRSCRRGKPWYCFNTHNATQPMTLADGQPLTPALGIGAFAEKTLVAAGQATKVNPAASPAAAGLLGCGVMAGLGAAMHTGDVQPGDAVAVFGCGGVGNAAIVGARLAGAATIVAVDLDPKKLELARQFGATHTVDASSGDVVEAVRALTDGNGADVCIEAVGRPEVMQQAFFARDLAGTLVQVGVPDPSMTIELPMIEFFGRGGALKPSWYGDCLPSRDFPMLIDLYLQGRLPLDDFVTETIPLDAVEAAFHKMERGEVLRSVVVL